MVHESFGQEGGKARFIYSLCPVAASSFAEVVILSIAANAVPYSLSIVHN